MRDFIGQSATYPLSMASSSPDPRRKKCTICARTANGRIARSPAARRSFQAVHPCPATGKTSGACPGFVVDHMKPLKCGGAHAPRNMQSETTAAAKAKDRVEYAARTARRWGKDLIRTCMDQRCLYGHHRCERCRRRVKSQSRTVWALATRSKGDQQTDINGTNPASIGQDVVELVACYCHWRSKNWRALNHQWRI